MLLVAGQTVIESKNASRTSTVGFPLLWQPPPGRRGR